jgi:hypothetical protein
VICRNKATGELIWRRSGHCPPGFSRQVADRLAKATKQVVETTAEGDLLLMRDDEEALW